MTIAEQQASQDAFMIIRELGTLCATPGIDDETKGRANDGIRKLVSGVIADSILKLNAKASGIVI